MYREITVKYVICSLHLFKQTQCVVLVLACFTDYGDRGEFQEPEFGYRGKFQWNFDQGKRNLVRFSGEFELSE